MNSRLRLVTPVPPKSDFDDGEMTITLVLPRACIGQPITVTLAQSSTPPRNAPAMSQTRHLPPPMPMATTHEEFELDLDSPEIISVGRASGAPLPTDLQAVAIDQRDRLALDDADGEIELDLDSPEVIAVFYDNLRPIEAPTRKAA